MATACAQGCLVFSVYTRPWITIMLAGWTIRPCARAIPAVATHTSEICNRNLEARAFIEMASFFMPLASKCRRRIDPQHPGFLAPGILPTMRRRAFKIQAVTGLQPVVFAFVQPDFKITAKHVQKFLTFVRVGLPATTAGLDAEEVGLHRRVSPGQQFHADIRRGFQNFSFRRADQARIVPRGLE